MPIGMSTFLPTQGVMQLVHWSVVVVYHTTLLMPCGGINIPYTGINLSYSCIGVSWFPTMIYPYPKYFFHKMVTDNEHFHVFLITF